MNRNIDDILVCKPFNWEECLWYLDRGFDDCMYSVSSEKVRRAFHFNGKQILTDIAFNRGTLKIEWLTGKPEPNAVIYVKDFISNWFDVNCDLTPFYNLLENRKEFAYMPQTFNGLHFIGIPDLFESLVWTIMGQQINLRFAYKIKRSLVETYGSSVEFENKKYWIFPAPEIIATLSLPELRALQLSAKKSEYILNIAEAFLSGTLSKNILQSLPDITARLNLLTPIKGIGTWTANYVLMKSLKENRAVPYGDVGLQKALVAHRIIADKNDALGISSFYESFDGWQAYMSLYLWRSMALKNPQ